jgi:hypothetical protein
MDHETAVKLGASERYLLGELTGEDRDSFEEHFFMCPECAEDVRALTVFAANAKAVFREKATGPAPHAGLFSSGRALRLSAALNAVLLLGLGYGLMKVAPEKPQFVQEVAVLGPSRGLDTPREIAAAPQRIVFSFYQTQPFRSIGYELKDEAGMVRSRRILPAPPKEDSAESHLSLPTAALEPGAYAIQLWGVEDSREIPIGSSKFKIGPTR